MTQNQGVGHLLDLGLDANLIIPHEVLWFLLGALGTREYGHSLGIAVLGPEIMSALPLRSAGLCAET